MSQVAVHLEEVTRSYPGSGLVLENFSVSVNQGDFFALYGPSASGKTTLLNLIAGLDNPERGTLRWGFSDRQPVVAYLFQNYEQTLFPWLTNESNIELPLWVNRHPSMKDAERRYKVKETLARLNMEIPLQMHPFEMSGGGKQKVALARAFVANPDILLLDEPFNSLDIRDREMMRAEVVRLWQETRVTVVLVTHDLDEALCLGNHLAIIGDRPARLMAPPIPIDIPYPRTSDLLASREFIELRRQALRLFEEGKAQLAQKVQLDAK